MQLLLKEQSDAMTTHLGFPGPIFEQTLKSLWLFYTSHLHIPVPGDLGRLSHDGILPPTASSAKATVFGRGDGPPRLVANSIQLSTFVTVSMSMDLTLGLCFLASIYLRMPVMLSDIHRWVLVGDLPFLLFKERLPHAVKTRLGNYYKHSTWVS